MNRLRILFALVLMSLAAAAVAATPACIPTLDHAWVRAAPPGASAWAAYATVRNPCTKAATINAVTSEDFELAMIHETVIENGVSRMRHIDALALPVGAEVVFAPGGRHMMLMGPKRSVNAGDTVRLSFELSDGRKLTADFPVRKDAP